MPDPQENAERIAAFLATQPRGSAGNLFVRRRLRMSDRAYWAARALLLAQGRVATGRGRGGSVRLLEGTAPTSPETTTAAEPHDGPTQVQVQVLGFAQVLQGGRPLALDDYQRPYVWTPANVRRLADDLFAHHQGGTRHLDYYMGTVLLHDDPVRGHRYVIDGQQRISTLCLLHHATHGAIPAGQAFRFRAPESARNLRLAHRALVTLDLPVDLLARVCFTVITVRAEDLAFTFFDTQNSRGVNLGATDLLKAFHLRAIRGRASGQVQERSARAWESAQRVSLPGASPQQAMQTLFEQVLWRARRWTGQGHIRWETHDTLMGEFETSALPASEDGTVPLYTIGPPGSGTRVQVGPGEQATLKGLPKDGPRDLADVPMAIRQPIHQGLGFFLYTERYMRLAERLFVRASGDPALSGLEAVDDMHKAAGLSDYLRQLFRLSTVVYVDRLGTAQLDAFCLWMDHHLGAVRLTKHSVFRATAMNMLRDGPVNLLDRIASAYRPEEVLSLLHTPGEHDAIYQQPLADRGVRLRYAEALLTFYGQTGSLGGKRSWIERRLSRRGP
mgnify:CR=1 FL=1